MKKTKIICLLVAAVLTVTAVCSCSTDSTPAVMELEGHRVTAAMYHYWASSMKGQYIYTYDDVNNTDEFWQSEFSNGVTMAEYLDGITLDNVKTTLAVMKLFDDYGLSLTSSEKSSISDYITDLVKERANGSKNMMNSLLGYYGVNLKILEEIYKNEAKSAHVYEYLYGENGTEQISDDDLNDYFEEYYLHFNMIYVNNAYKYVTDSNGSMVTDDSGYYKTEELDEAEQAEKDAAIASAKEKLDGGADFADVYNEYDELGDRMDYYYSVSDAYDSEIYYKLMAAAAAAKDGDICVVESDLGTCIIEKLPLGEGDWQNSEYEDFFPASGSNAYRDKVCEALFSEKLHEYFDKITVDEEAIKKFSVANVVPCYFF